MRALDIQKLEKTYGSGTKALKGVDLEIPEGSFYGLLGPNGAGKSTLIHCITGLAIPSGGHALVFGKDSVTEYRDARRFVGFSPQEINLDWFLTVEGTLEYHGRYFDMPRDERKKRAEELMKSFSLYDKRRDLTRFLSGIWLDGGKRIVSRQYIIVSQGIKKGRLANIGQADDRNR